MSDLSLRKPFLMFSTDNDSGGDISEKTEDPENVGSEEDKQSKEEVVTMKKSEYQATIDKIVTERLERERRKNEKERDKEKEELELKQLEEKEEWKKLAEKSTAKVTTLEAELAALISLKEKQDKYEKALKTYVDSLRKGIPEHVVTLLDKLDPVEQLEYISANIDALRKKPIPESPDPANPEKLSEAEREQYEKQSGFMYRNII
jgi:hypothetical protein